MNSQQRKALIKASMGIAKVSSETACAMIQQIQRNEVKYGETIIQSMAEMTINGITFQVQLHFASDKSHWIPEDVCVIATMMQVSKQ